MVGAPLLCRSDGVWRLVGVSGRQHCGQPGRAAPARAFDSLAANRHWMQTSMASFREAEPRPTPAAPAAAAEGA